LHSDEIPGQAGSYALLFHLEHPLRLSVGKLGSFNFPVAAYLYFGSANGSGGLRARLQRHISGNGHPHWHIDSFCTVASLEEIFFLVAFPHPSKPPARLECVWSQAVVCLPTAFIPAPRFGASDCSQRCPAHFVGLSEIPDTLTGLLAHAAGEDPTVLRTIRIR